MVSSKEIQENFAPISPPFIPSQAVTEAQRCLYCDDAPCIAACPTSIDIPTFIKKIATGNLKGSARTILSANIFGASCGTICPVEVLCEGACVMHPKNEKPIEIGRLQRYAVDHALKNKIQFFEAGKPNGKRAAIIGAGPSGLACGHELRRLGYEVDVFEKDKMPGGLNTYGIAEYKMNKSLSLSEIENITAIGVKIHFGVSITAKKAQELAETYDAVFIGIGLGGAEDLHIPGENLAGVWDALEFIRLIKTKPLSQVPIGKRVAVVGGGNTAIDAVTQAKRLGADPVYMVYRRSEKEVKAYHYELDIARKDEVVFVWQSAPKRILGKKKVEGLECVRMRLGKPDATGRARPEAIPKSEFVLDVDRVIKAVGQKRMAGFFSALGLASDKSGRLIINEKGQTSNPKLFSGGDCASGGAEVVNAVAEGKKAAHGIHEFLFPRRV